MPPVPSTLDTPWKYAQELLDLCQVLLADTEDLSVIQHPGGEIERAYRWFGKVVADCEQITVSWSGFGERSDATFPTGLRHVYGRVNLISFTIMVIRDCVPLLSEDERSAPEIARAEESARELLRDAWSIWSGIYSSAKAGELFQGRCSELYMIRADPLEPQGDLAGFEIELAAQIDGMIAVGGS